MTSTRLEPLECNQCKAPLRWDACNAPSAANTCSSCGAPVDAYVFPAFLAALELGQQAEVAIAQQDANCFYHDDKRAIAACNHCGRLLCSLCDVVMRGENLCPVCISRGKEKGTLQRLEPRRIMHDNIALLLSISPLILGWLGVLVAPVAIFYAAFRWRAPSSLVPRTKIRFVAAMILAVLSIGVSVFVMIAAFIA
jgi:hypothetical protein